jgi:hypothetical protein
VTAPLDPMAEAVRVLPWGCSDCEDTHAYEDCPSSPHRWSRRVEAEFTDWLVRQMPSGMVHDPMAWAASVWHFANNLALTRPSEDTKRLDTTNLRERLADAYVLRESSNPTVAKLAELCRDAHDVLAAINAGAGQ